jgi:hypothetical protein
MTDTLPRARLHAAAAAQATWRNTPGCLHPMVLADYLQELGEEHSDPELRDRAELARLEGELEKLTATVRGFGSKAKSRHWNMLTPLQHRITSLQARLSAWPCPECGGVGYHGTLQYSYECACCRGAQDVLLRHVPIPLTWDCGYPRWVTLTTMGDAVERRLIDPHDYRPTPRLRALASAPPWGVPLEGVRVGDRKPPASGRYSGEWYWAEGERMSEEFLPTPLFDRLGGRVVINGLRFCYHPTESAAVDALARGVITFAREYRT